MLQGNYKKNFNEKKIIKSNHRFHRFSQIKRLRFKNLCNLWFNVFVFSFFVFLFSGNAYSEIYKWVDDKGEVHFTDNPSNIPEQYLNQTERKTPPPLLREQPTTPPLLRGTEKKEAVTEKSPAPVKEETKVKEGVSPDDPNAVTLDGGIKEETKEKREKVTYSGMAKNNSNTELNNIEIFFTIKGKDGKEETLSSLIKGKKGEGILEPGEAGSFTIQPETPFPSIAGYGYSFKWRFTTQPQK
jgi:hypothetical protein